MPRPAAPAIPMARPSTKSATRIEAKSAAYAHSARHRTTMSPCRIWRCRRRAGQAGRRRAPRRAGRPRREDRPPRSPSARPPRRSPAAWSRWPTPNARPDPQGQAARPDRVRLRLPAGRDHREHPPRRPRPDHARPHQSRLTQRARVARRQCQRELRRAGLHPRDVAVDGGFAHGPSPSSCPTRPTCSSRRQSTRLQTHRAAPGALPRRRRRPHQCHLKRATDDAAAAYEARRSPNNSRRQAGRPTVHAHVIQERAQDAQQPRLLAGRQLARLHVREVALQQPAGQLRRRGRAARRPRPASDRRSAARWWRQPVPPRMSELARFDTANDADSSGLRSSNTPRCYALRPGASGACLAVSSLRSRGHRG